jgi:hypothetical protein
MFDATTAQLIRGAPPIGDVAPETLPQELTRVYAELLATRLRHADVRDEPDRLKDLLRLKRIADTYEAAVDIGAEGEPRRAAAFVAATAHQLLARVLSDTNDPNVLLRAGSIHPATAAPLLFLVAEQNADAREAARPLQGLRVDNLLLSAVIESIYELATERYDEILSRGERLRRARVSQEETVSRAGAQALYGMCWAGIVQMVARLVGREPPQMEFFSLDSPQLLFERVVGLSVQDLQIADLPGLPISSYSGPRHLARLLWHVADSLEGAGIMSVAPPGGTDPQLWSRWLRHRAQTKPVLWRNHRQAIHAGLLETERSTVLVLPTGAGKTTVSELKIAATLARGRKVLFLVPTLALVDQLRDELAEMFPASIADVEVSADGDLAALVSGPELQAIEVMTPERCLALLSHAPEAAENVGLLVFDECHLLSPGGGGKRSLDAMLALLQVLKRASQADLLLLSAMLTNADEFGAWIAEITGRACDVFQDTWKPSRQARGVLLYHRRELTSRPPMVTPHALFGLHQNWNPAVPADLRLIKLTDKQVPLSLNKQRRPTPNANNVAARLAVEASTSQLKTIVFVQNAGHAPSTARKATASLNETAALTPLEETLWSAVVAELGGEAYALFDPKSGALPHNGDMISQERRLVESLFRRDGGANVIVATPTLAQGMNLPAQLAILAGDKRHEEDGRAELEPHEILNAAGRAGRAGHLANGMVLLIPEPVIGIAPNGRPAHAAFAKLRSILPASDQCVAMEDPISTILDRIQVGDVEVPKVRYFLSKIRAGEAPEEAAELAIQTVQKSFAAFKARQRGAEAAFNQKVDSLKAILAADAQPDSLAVVAASTGFSDAPLKAMQDRIGDDLDAAPVSIVGWADWLVDFFRDDRSSYETLLGADADTLLFVVRGKKSGPPISDQEFARLKRGFRAWLIGRPFCEIEAELGAAANKVKHCPRARDFALKLANRNFYLIASAMTVLVQELFRARDLALPHPAALEALAIAFRRGLDTPEKAAFAHLTPNIRTRVLVHKAYQDEFGGVGIPTGMDFLSMLDHMRTIRAFFQ